MNRFRFRLFYVKKNVSLKVILKRSNSNVFVTVSGLKDRSFKVFSSGSLGFSNSKKDTPYAAEAVGKFAARYILLKKNNIVSIVLNSPLDGRLRAVLRGISSFSSLLRVVSVRSKFSPAHNGCRPKKTRRV